MEGQPRNHRITYTHCCVCVCIASELLTVLKELRKSLTRLVSQVELSRL